MKYAVYHKFGGYITADNNYTDNPQDAKLYNTREEAELEVCSYLERVEIV
jgi:hypothetical protein